MGSVKVKVEESIYKELVQARRKYIEDLGEDFPKTVFNDLDYLINKLSFMGFRKAYTWAKENRKDFAGGMAQGFTVKSKTIEKGGDLVDIKRSDLNFFMLNMGDGYLSAMMQASLEGGLYKEIGGEDEENYLGTVDCFMKGPDVSVNVMLTHDFNEEDTGKILDIIESNLIPLDVKMAYDIDVSFEVFYVKNEATYGK